MQLTTDEVAQSLGVSRIAVQQAVRRGTLKAVKRSGVWFITSKEVERYRFQNLGKVGKRKKRA